MDFDLRAHTLLLTVSGSRAYGTHTPGSDVDLKGVLVPPGRYLHGFANSFEQCDDQSSVAGFSDLLTDEERAASVETKVEGVVYALRKFARLAVDCNPNILDVLYCRDAEVRLVTPLGQRLRDARSTFLSAKARHTYSGYAMAQLKRIRGHRKWLLDPPKRQPTRADFGLPEQALIAREQLDAAQAAIKRKLDEWEIDFDGLGGAETVRLKERMARSLAEQGIAADDRWRGAARSVGLHDDLIHVMARERTYRSEAQHFRQYQQWKAHRNPARAKLEAAHGYDTKHGSHLIRLLRMGREILETGEVHVWRGDRDADELLGIRGGEWSYEELVSHAEAELQRISAIKRMAVPRKPNRGTADRLVVELVEAALSRAGS